MLIEWSRCIFGSGAAYNYDFSYRSFMKIEHTCDAASSKHTVDCLLNQRFGARTPQYALYPAWQLYFHNTAQVSTQEAEHIFHRTTNAAQVNGRSWSNMYKVNGRTNLFQL